MYSCLKLIHFLEKTYCECSTYIFNMIIIITAYDSIRLTNSLFLLAFIWTYFLLSLTYMILYHESRVNLKLTKYTGS